GSAAAAGGQAITRAAGLPGGVTRQEDDDDNGGGGFQGSTFNANQASARISITQFIDITGILRTAEQLGDLQLALTRLELARQRQQVALDVRNGYYNVLRSQAFVRVNEAAVAQSQELVRVTEAQKSAGVAAEFDVLRARTQLENNRQALITSRNQVLIARNAFANSLGIDPSTVVDLQDVTDVPAVPELNEEALLTQALAQRPEYLQADVNILKAAKNTRLARRGLEPFLNVAINAGYAITEPALGSERETGNLALALGVPLWDGGATRAAVDSARADERIAAITKDQYVRGIKAEVQQAAVAVRDAAERRTSAEANVAQAREALRLAGVRFRAGVGTQLEINDAQTALTLAETNQVNAQYDYLAALARLSRAVGAPA
ncbi:MAG TPA: TolC family protein, partial [Armatimonadaceae bacterium]|nr:TolC family protein [Armatimonadaceae bacterium]